MPMHVAFRVTILFTYTESQGRAVEKRIRVGQTAACGGETGLGSAPALMLMKKTKCLASGGMIWRLSSIILWQEKQP